MQMQLFLCILTLYEIISHTVGIEDSDESRSDEDNFVLHLGTSDTTLKRKIKDGSDEADYTSKNNDDNLAFSSRSAEKNPKIQKENKEYEAEIKQGDMADLFGTNQHHSYPDAYTDLGRRFVPQYPYKEVSITNEEDEAETLLDNIAKDFADKDVHESNLIPIKAPPELVLAVATKAALLEAAIPHNSVEESLIDKKILRSGDYWNNVWQEEVQPNILRTHEVKVVQPVNVKVLPGSKLYNLMSELKKISPKLLYVINRK